MKVIKLFILCLLLTFMVTGCATPISSESDLDGIGSGEQNEGIGQEAEGKIDLLDVFPTGDKVSLYYHGFAEYGHILTLDSNVETDKGRTISYHGVMDWGADDEDLTFIVSYVFEGDKVMESVRLDFDYKDSDTLNSIIPNKIVLQGDIVEGNSWTYKAAVAGENTERDVTTTITKVEHLPISDIIIFTTETVINDIEGYYGGEYTEIRTYAEGYGLIAFENTLPVVYDDDGDELDTFYQFGYGLTGYTKEPFASYENLTYEDLYKIGEELEEYFRR